MTLRRTLLLALAVLPVGSALAQVGGMQTPAVCQQLVMARDETQKQGQALSAAGRKKAPPEEICKLFKVFLAAETTMVNGLEEHSATCGVPADVIRQVKAQHLKASQMAKQVCAVAARGMPSQLYAPAPQCAEKTLTTGVPCVD